MEAATKSAPGRAAPFSASGRTLVKLIAENYITQKTHPTLPLAIYNYTFQTQSKKAWNPTTRHCRGLVLDDQYHTIARPLPKFFNLNEEPGELPNGTPDIFEKLDGSMILLFFFADEWQVASRDSFTSEQAVKARDLLQNYQDDMANLDRANTYMLEVIYPRNRIVIDYGAAERLVMLTGIHTATGDEVPLAEIPWSDRPKTYPATDLPAWMEAIDPSQYSNHEGFILKWPCGFRVKYKLEEYVRLHRVLTRNQDKDVWECLKNGQPLDNFLENRPDRYYQRVTAVQKRLLTEYEAILTSVNSLFKPLADFGGDRKAASAYINRQPHSSILFLRLNGRDYREAIWQQIKPEFRQPTRIADPEPDPEPNLP